MEVNFVLSRSSSLEKKGAFYRSPRNRAVAGNLHRSLRSGESEVSGLARSLRFTRDRKLRPGRRLPKSPDRLRPYSGQGTRGAHHLAQLLARSKIKRSESPVVPRPESPVYTHRNLRTGQPRSLRAVSNSQKTKPEPP